MRTASVVILLLAATLHFKHADSADVEVGETGLTLRTRNSKITQPLGSVDLHCQTLYILIKT
jgi:hypothetical protein